MTEQGPLRGEVAKLGGGKQNEPLPKEKRREKSFGKNEAKKISTTLRWRGQITLSRGQNSLSETP